MVREIEMEAVLFGCSADRTSNILDVIVMASCLWNEYIEKLHTSK